MTHFQYLLSIDFIRKVSLLGLGQVEVDCFRVEVMT